MLRKICAVLAIVLVFAFLAGCSKKTTMITMMALSEKRIVLDDVEYTLESYSEANTNGSAYKLYNASKYAAFLLKVTNKGKSSVFVTATLANLMDDFDKKYGHMNSAVIQNSQGDEECNPFLIVGVSVLASSNDVDLNKKEKDYEQKLHDSDPEAAHQYVLQKNNADFNSNIGFSNSGYEFKDTMIKPGETVEGMIVFDKLDKNVKKVSFILPAAKGGQNGVDLRWDFSVNIEETEN